MPKWTFEKLSPKSVARDPFEAEFFTGEEDGHVAYGRTDGLVREAIQNSLDARDPEAIGPVRVRFAISEDGEHVCPEVAENLLEGLKPHFTALRNELINGDGPPPNMRCLVIEDFGTRGLEGDPAWNKLTIPEDAPRQDFYWFWRNIGRSGKGETDLGRWGLGKTVFPSLSRINAVFGLTVRVGDNRKLLMGQAVTKVHEVDGDRYHPEGFYCDPTNSAMLQMPFEDDPEVGSFEAAFRLERGDSPGLSVVVPYCAERISAREIVRTAIVHFFIPVLRGDLVIDVSGPGIQPTSIDPSTIRGLAANLKWDGNQRDKKHAPPPFDLADWAIKQQAEAALYVLKAPQGDNVPKWTESTFDDDQLDMLRNAFDEQTRIGVRVPIRILRKAGTNQESHFDVFIERDADLARSEDHFVREGMTISRISTLVGKRGFRALVLIEDRPLSALLGDAEGPAHTAWGTGEDRPERTYRNWKGRVTFVRESVRRLVGLLSPPPQGLEVDWLQDIFAIEDPARAGSRSSTPGKPGKKPPPPPPPPPPPKARPFALNRTGSGFSVHAAGDGPVPARIRVRVAYDINRGNAFRAYSPYDFVFDKGKSQLQIATSEVVVRIQAGNTLEFTPLGPDFSVEVMGFDSTRDLIIKALEVEGDS